MQNQASSLVLKDFWNSLKISYIVVYLKEGITILKHNIWHMDLVKIVFTMARQIYMHENLLTKFRKRQTKLLKF